MKKRGMMRLVACIMTLCLIWTTCLPGVRAASYAASNTATFIGDHGDYGISNILSKFQYFVFSNSNATGHTNGAIIVGKDGSCATNGFGDASIVPSYIGNVISAGNFNVNVSAVGADKKCNIVYYNNDSQGPRSDSWMQNTGYIDLTNVTDFTKAAAYMDIQKESSGLAENSTVINADGEGFINIDCTKGDVYVKVPYSILFSQEKNVKINLVIEDLEWLQKQVCCVSIINVPSNVANLDFNFDYGGKIQINGMTDLTNAFKDDNKWKLPGGTFGDQVNLQGLNLVWNFPDANGIISANQLGGHIVAPNATVNVGANNYEGGVIANNIEGGAEGHFYPMNKALKTTGTSSGNGSGNTEEPSGGTGDGTGTEGGTGTESGTGTGGGTGTTPGTGTTTPGTSTGTDTPSTATGGLEIVVQDEKTGDPVPNAKVEIVYPNGRRDTATTDENGKITKEGLEPGDYTVTVTEVPDGYSVTTGQQDKVTVVANETKQHVVKINSEGAANADKEDDEDDEDDTDDTDDGGEAEAASRNAAKTGDAFPVAVPVVLLIGAVVAMSILGYNKKRYE